MKFKPSFSIGSSRHAAPWRCQVRRGGAALEFALCAPILLLVLGGMVEWGWYFSQQILVEGAARDAARAGATADKGADLAQIAERRARSSLDGAGFDGDGASVSVSTWNDAELGEEVLEVQVSVDHHPLVSLVPVLGAHEAEVIMYVVNP